MSSAMGSNSITKSDINNLFNYCEKTGLLKWRHAGSGRKLDAEAGSLTAEGYRMICVNHKRYMAHRLVWIYHFGDIGDKTIDHINGDRADNRIENLRLATVGENSRNQKLLKRNTSGYKGVVFYPDMGKWNARIQRTVNGKSIFRSLGFFLKKEDAAHAYDAAAVDLFGEFACINFPNDIGLHEHREQLSNQLHRANRVMR